MVPCGTYMPCALPDANALHTYQLRNDDKDLLRLEPTRGTFTVRIGTMRLTLSIDCALYTPNPSETWELAVPGCNDFACLKRRLGPDTPHLILPICLLIEHNWLARCVVMIIYH